LALPWRAAGAASAEKPLATMKAANERAKIGRQKWLIEFAPVFVLA
jgi:hypothetical protein